MSLEKVVEKYINGREKFISKSDFEVVLKVEIYNLNKKMNFKNFLIGGYIFFASYYIFNINITDTVQKHEGLSLFASLSFLAVPFTSLFFIGKYLKERKNIIDLIEDYKFSLNKSLTYNNPILHYPYFKNFNPNDKRFLGKYTFSFEVYE